LIDFANLPPLPPVVQQLLNIDPDDLTQELVHQPQLYARFGVLHAEAVGNVQRCRFLRDRAWAHAWNVAREAILREGGKPTEATTNMRAELDPAYIEATAARAAAEEEERALETLKLAFDQRSRMLLVLAGADRRTREQAHA